jgi:hypothetical protein
MLWQKICVQNFSSSTRNLGDSSLSGDISLSPTKGEGPLVRASSPTINLFNKRQGFSIIEKETESKRKRKIY